VSRPVGTPQLGLSLAAPPPPRLSGLCARANWSSHASTIRLACGPGRLDGMRSRNRQTGLSRGSAVNWPPSCRCGGRGKRAQQARDRVPKGSAYDAGSPGSQRCAAVLRAQPVSRRAGNAECAGVAQPCGSPISASGVRAGGTQLSRNIARLRSPAAPQETAMVSPEEVEALIDALKQTAPVLVLLSTIAVLWWRSAHPRSLG
jgi:hypothetical protein